MKYGIWGVTLIMFGLTGVVFIVMFEAITINNEAEFYTLRETMEAAMLESIDLACYRIGGADGEAEVDIDKDGVIDSTYSACGDNQIKIIEQLFVENFTRRFAKNVTGDVTKYKIDFYDIMESPPKATVVINGTTQSYALTGKDKATAYEIVNDLSGILELNND